MTTTPPPEGWDRNDGPFVHRPPEDYRPTRPQSASGPEQTYVRDGKRYTYRQVGWHGQTGAFYSLDETPSDHEPGGWSPLHLLAFVEDVIAPDDGLYAKYDVRRTDGREKPDARYFVLDYAGDPAARTALVAYADACEDNQPGLAAALRTELADLAAERMSKPAAPWAWTRRPESVTCYCGRHLAPNPRHWQTLHDFSAVEIDVRDDRVITFRHSLMETILVRAHGERHIVPRDLIATLRPGQPAELAPPPVLIDIRPHLAGLNCLPGDVVVLAMTIDVNITADGPVADEPEGVTKRVDTSGRHGTTTLQIHTRRDYVGPVGKLTPEPLVLAFDGAGPDARPIALERDEAGQLWTVDPDALDRLFLSPTSLPVADDPVD